MRRYPHCVNVNETAGVGYIDVRTDDAPVARTVWVNEDCALDFDAAGRLLGVELLDLSIFDPSEVETRLELSEEARALILSGQAPKFRRPEILDDDVFAPAEGPCGRCGQPCKGLATINGTPYHHGDNHDQQSCYSQQLYDDAFPPSDPPKEPNA